MKDKIEELRKWAENEGTEYGDYCLALCNLAETYMPDDFKKHTNKEIQKCLQWFKDNCEMVERTKIKKETWYEVIQKT